MGGPKKTRVQLGPFVGSTERRPSPQGIRASALPIPGAGRERLGTAAPAAPRMAMATMGVQGPEDSRGEDAAKRDRNTKACQTRGGDAPAESDSDRRKSSLVAVRLESIVRLC